MKHNRLVLLLSLVLLACSAFRQDVGTPAPGTSLRKTLLDALRQPLEKELKQPVIFTVSTMKTTTDWAFGLLTPTQPTGKLINYRNTPYWDAVKEGIFDDGLCVLWQRKQGIWTVRTYVLGATDVPYGCWWKEYNAPKSVLLYAEKNCDFINRR